MGAPAGKSKKARADSGTLLLGLMVFAMVLAMLLGNVRLYEYNEAARSLEDKIAAQREQITMLEAEKDSRTLSQQAEALGLVTPDPAQVEILHVRGNHPAD